MHECWSSADCPLQYRASIILPGLSDSVIGVLGNHTPVLLGLSDNMIVNILWVLRSTADNSVAHVDYENSRQYEAHHICWLIGYSKQQFGCTPLRNNIGWADPTNIERFTLTWFHNPWSDIHDSWEQNGIQAPVVWHSAEARVNKQVF